MKLPRYLNTSQASVYLKNIGVGYTKKSLEVLRCQGRGPAFRRVGRRVFYTPADLDAFAAGTEIKTVDSMEL